MNEIKDLVAISKYAGERFDLVQAGGGNSSVKLDDGTMLIKASGFLLSDVEENAGYSRVFTKNISDIIHNKEITESVDKREKERLASLFVNKATADQKNRPSIETLLHSLLYKYTLHTHPIVVNMLVNKSNWIDNLKSIFDEDILLVDYKTPGIELAQELYKQIAEYGKIPNIIFLQNHGMIVSSEIIGEIKILTDYVLNKIEKYLKIDMNKYKLTNKISNLINKIDNHNYISYLSNDLDLITFLSKNKNLFFKTPFCPDSLVFCGICAVEISDLDDLRSINEYKERYYDIPKVVLYQDNLFIIAKNIKKAKEIEDVLRFHIMILAQNPENIIFLKFDELAYLSNWEAEKYRQKL